MCLLKAEDNISLKKEPMLYKKLTSVFAYNALWDMSLFDVKIQTTSVESAISDDVCLDVCSTAINCAWA